MEGQALAEYVAVARDENCLFMHDEFYNHYMHVGEVDRVAR